MLTPFVRRTGQRLVKFGVRATGVQAAISVSYAYYHFYYAAAANDGRSDVQCGAQKQIWRSTRIHQSTMSNDGSMRFRIRKWWHIKTQKRSPNALEQDEFVALQAVAALFGAPFSSPSSSDISTAMAYLSPSAFRFEDPLFLLQDSCVDVPLRSSDASNSVGILRPAPPSFLDSFQCCADADSTKTWALYTNEHSAVHSWARFIKVLVAPLLGEGHGSRLTAVYRSCNDANTFHCEVTHKFIAPKGSFSAAWVLPRIGSRINGIRDNENTTSANAHDEMYAVTSLLTVTLEAAKAENEHSIPDKSSITRQCWYKYDAQEKEQTQIVVLSGNASENKNESSLKHNGLSSVAFVPPRVVSAVHHRWFGSAGPIIGRASTERGSSSRFTEPVYSYSGDGMYYGAQDTTVTSSASSKREGYEALWSWLTPLLEIPRRINTTLVSTVM